MKTSPLQLDFVLYPKVAFEARIDGDPEKDLPQEVVVEATVSYSGGGDHTALLTIRSTKTDESRKFDFEIDAFAKFRMDLEGARAIYRNDRYPLTAAVNVARILYSGAREFLSIVGARSPYSNLNLASVLLNVEDIEVEFGDDGTPEKFAKEFFGVDLAQISTNGVKKNDAVNAPQAPAKKSPKKKGAKRSAEKVAVEPKQSD